MSNADRELLRSIEDQARETSQMLPLAQRAAVALLVLPIFKLLHRLIDRIEKLEKERQP